MSRNKKENTNENPKLLEEDTTKYGEFISSYFAWLTLDKQKQNTKAMEKMTQKEK